MRISAERFIEVWQSAESIDVVSEQLGISKKSASERASRLRGKGVPLQRFSQPELDYDELATLAEELAENQARLRELGL